MGELDAHGRPRTMTIKCRVCGKQFKDTTRFNKHKISHKRRLSG